MGCFLKCIFHVCCDNDEERESNPYTRSGLPPSSTRMSSRGRGNSFRVVDGNGNSMMSSTTNVGNGGGMYQAAAQSEQHHTVISNSGNNNEEELTDCCRSCRGGEVDASHPQARGIRDLFRRVRERWRRYDTLETVGRERAGSTGTDVSSIINNGNDHHFGMSSRRNSSSVGVVAGRSKPKAILPASPLRTALSYDTTKELPSIHAEEVVLPGSLLQKEMARAMSLNLEKQGDECVICMEGFDPTNPRMPTLCGCGENKTYFHLPCLYQWVEQSRECPSCRQPLRWEEF